MFSIIFSHKYFNTFLIALLAIIVSCNKKFDEPPINAEPDIAVTMSIKDLKARYQAPGMFQRITDDQTISGVVVADDRSGNFFKQIVIQDTTGGITLSIDMNSIYSSYPVGRRVFVKLKDLMLGDYGGTIQIGYDSSRSNNGRFLNLVRIPQAKVSDYLIPGSYGNVVTPKIIKPSDFTGNILDPLLNTLIQINNAEFKDADLAKTYANAANPTSESARNFTIKPCDDNKSIVLRNSSYATFAGLPVAQGNGSLVGIFSVFNGTIQLAIRDTFDVQFKGQRCSGNTPITTTKTIAEVLEYAKGDSTIPAGTWIEGTIISDTKNEAAGNYRLQDATAGIQLRFTTASNPSATLGDKYSVYVGGMKLSVFNGGIQVNNVEISNKTGSGTVTPKTTTIASIITAGRTWESQVVTIKDVTITRSGNNYTIKDVTGEIITHIRPTSGITMPTGASSITGYVSIYQSPAAGSNPVVQLTLRTQADIVGGTQNPVPTDPPPTTGESDLLISEYIEGSSNNKYIEIYNAGSTKADLSLYEIKLYTNGSTTTSNTLKLSDVTDTLEPGKIIVIQNAQASLTLPTGVTGFSSTVTYFNGDDVLELTKNGTVIDVFGQKGVDPGTSFTVAGDANGALDKTVRRKTSITKGNPDWSKSAGTNATDSEWIIAAKDDVSNLGSR